MKTKKNRIQNDLNSSEHLQRLTIIAFGLAVTGALTYFGLSQPKPLATVPSPENRAIANIPVQKQAPPIAQSLTSKKWSEVRDQLAKDETEKSIAQILRYLESAAPDIAVTDELFTIIVEHLVSAKRSAKEQVLATRCFAVINLKKEQQVKVRSVYKTNIDSRFSENLLPLAFTGTNPYPKDLEKQLSKVITGKDHTLIQDSIYSASMLKDLKARQRISLNLLNSFFHTNDALQPLLARFLLSTADPEIKKNKKFGKLLSYIQAQKGEVWQEVKSQAQ
jgi:hypothetical protein